MGTSSSYLMAVTAVLFWGANFVLAEYVLQDLPPLWAAAVRFLLGALLMLGIAGVRHEGLIGLLRRNFAIYLALGVVGIAAFNLMFFYALQSTSPNNAALIMATNPLLTAILAAVFLKERITRRHMVALPVAFGGVAIVITEGDLSHLASLTLARGDVLMLCAALSWAGYNVMVKRYMPSGAVMAHTSWIMTAGALILLVAALAAGGEPHWPRASAQLALATMVVGGTVLAYLFWGMAIARLGAGKAAIFMNLIPVFAMLTGMLLGLVPTLAQLAGGVLVLGGVALATVPIGRRQGAL